MKRYEKIQSKYTEYQQEKPIIPGATEGSDFIDSLKARVIYIVLRINGNWTLLNNYLNTLGSLYKSHTLPLFQKSVVCNKFDIYVCLFVFFCV